MDTVNTKDILVKYSRQQGWNSDSQLLILTEFLNEMPLAFRYRLETYLKDRAREENKETHEDENQCCICGDDTHACDDCTSFKDTA